MVGKNNAILGVYTAKFSERESSLFWESFTIFYSESCEIKVWPVHVGQEGTPEQRLRPTSADIAVSLVRVILRLEKSMSLVLVDQKVGGSSPVGGPFEDSLSFSH